MQNTVDRKPLVVYHAGCSDGFAAAWCFWHFYKDSYEYFPGVYQGALPDIVDRDVYLVDFSFKRDKVELMLQYAKSVTLLDHHASALTDLWDFAKFNNFNMEHCSLEKSGARIAWDFIKQKEKHTKKVPRILEHIEDRDLWKFKLEHTREIMAAVFSYDYTFETYEKLMSLGKTGLNQLYKEGVAIERKYQKDLKGLAKQVVRMARIGGFDVPIANANGHFASDLGNMLSHDVPFAAIYYDTAEFRNFSLRSQDTGLDVTEIAKKYGGGGHPRASGFKVPRDHELAQI